MFRPQSVRLAEEVLEAAGHRDLTVVTAESVTGGLVAGCLTEVPGASTVLEGGFVTYQDRFKQELLGVPAKRIQAHGAVSAQVTRAMLEGALAHSEAGVAVAVTGYASAGPGVPEQAQGVVHLAAGQAGGEVLEEEHAFPGNRSDVRQGAIHAALALLLDAIRLEDD